MEDPTLADRILEIQAVLADADLDGWLFSCFQQNDPISLELLGLNTGQLVTRRCYYLVPREGEPRKLNHILERFEQAGLWTESDPIVGVNANNADPYDSLGEALQAAGRREDATRNFSRSLELNPENSNAKKRLQEITSEAGAREAGPGTPSILGGQR